MHEINRQFNANLCNFDQFFLTSTLGGKSVGGKGKGKKTACAVRAVTFICCVGYGRPGIGKLPEDASGAEFPHCAGERGPRRGDWGERSAEATVTCTGGKVVVKAVGGSSLASSLPTHAARNRNAAWMGHPVSREVSKLAADGARLQGFEEGGDEGDGEADYVEVVALDAGNPAGGAALDGVSAGFVHRLIGGDVGVNFFV